ncbi:MAG: hypothetical protein P4N59_13195 [Negativicutes bacterium]|nr:hypothetical protein [Negativicutes bacterium]
MKPPVYWPAEFAEHNRMLELEWFAYRTQVAIYNAALTELTCVKGTYKRFAQHGNPQQREYWRQQYKNAREAFIDQRDAMTAARKRYADIRETTPQRA